MENQQKYEKGNWKFKIVVKCEFYLKLAIIQIAHFENEKWFYGKILISQREIGQF